jgi:hypothetical protein
MVPFQEDKARLFFHAAAIAASARRAATGAPSSE